MEGAERVFAGDFSGSTLAVPGKDSGSTAWVVTPGGAWCRSVYLCGALTEVTENADVLHCRLADPTGAFDLVTKVRQGVVREQIRTILVPSFVAVTGTARLYRKNGIWEVSVKPEYIREINKSIRNRWIVATADMMLDRLEILLAALEGRSRDAKAERVVRHYDTTKEQISIMVTMIQSALTGIPSTTGELAVAETDISARVMEIICAKSGPRGVAVQDIIDEGISLGCSQAAVLSAIETLITNDDCYQPQKGYVKPL
jgi:RPA family protein